MTAVLGQRLLRREDAEILTGEAKYIDDLQITGALWLALVRSPMARARIRSIDTSEAKASPGVVAVFTGEELMGEWAAPLPVALTATPDQKVPTHYPLTSGAVNYVGDAVAVHFELRFDRTVHDLVVVVEALVAPTDPSFVQDQSRSMAQREGEDLTCLPAQGMPFGERDVSEVKRDHILEGKVRHLRTLRRRRRA